MRAFRIAASRRRACRVSRDTWGRGRCDTLLREQSLHSCSSRSLARVTPPCSGQLTESLLSELGDKNWKQRQEALSRLAGLLDQAKFVEPSLGDAPAALRARMLDLNKNLVGPPSFARTVSRSSRSFNSLGQRIKRKIVKMKIWPRNFV